MTFKLTDLCIGNFKSFGKEQHIRFSDITLFIGANGSGKSNLIAFFEMLSYMMNKNLAQFIATHGRVPAFSHLGDRKKSISATLVFKSELHETSYEFTLAPTVSNDFVFTGEVMRRRELTWPSRLEDRLNKLQNESALPDYIHTKDGAEIPVKANEIFILLKGFGFFRFNDTSSSAEIRQDSYINNTGYLMSSGGNLAAFLYGLKEQTEFSPYYERIVRNIQLAYPSFKDFELEPKFSNSNYITLDWQDKSSPPNFRFSPQQLSDGTLRFMALTALLLQPPETIPKVIVIDEPELGLHPTALSLLASMVYTASKHSQIVMATQSAELLDYFKPEHIRVVEREGSNSVVTEPDKEQLDYWLENYSLGQIWEKNVIGGRP